ncbi:calcium-dependent protein kinase 19 [Selaginella moellendorffii]|nr:calcium-dependent protein kinase 19 [Selaginella moellendorffii]|eukprot:XP_002972777.2 calcium-dependent protein kinase 19 [Selaginella moellendorffii]
MEMNAKTMEMLFPNLLDKFQVTKTIGMGGFSTVFEVIRLRDGKHFACKTNSMMGDDKLILQELKIMAQLRHDPGVVRLVAIVRDLGFCHIIMELCEGTLLSRLPLGEDEAALVVAKVAETLQRMHALGMAHNDIKPGNILVGYDGEVKVADFGLSWQEGQGKGPLMRGGTARYMPPGERFKESCDIWALGVTLYEMLTGKIAYEELQTPQVLSELERYEDLPLILFDWSRVPVLAKDLMLGMLNLDKKKRLTAAQILEHPWIKRITQNYNRPASDTKVEVKAKQDVRMMGGQASVPMY